MTTNAGHHHRASGLRQQNKKFKAKHATKGAIKELAKGKVERPTAPSRRRVISTASAPTPGNPNRVSSKADRRNAAKVAQRNKRDALVAANRVFAPEWDKKSGAPKVVAVVPLCGDVDAREVVRGIYGRCLSGSGGETGVDLEKDVEGYAPMTFNVPRHSLRLQLLPLPRDLLSITDACLAADHVILVLSALVEVDSWGEQVLACLKTQGVPGVVGVVQHLDSVAHKMQLGVRRSLHLYLSDHFPNTDPPKPFHLSAEQEVDQLVRYLSESRIRAVGWREGRTWIVSEGVKWCEDTEQGVERAPGWDEPKEGDRGNGSEVEKGLLKVTGWVRGSNLCANRLVHLTDCGDFAIRRVESPPSTPPYLPIRSSSSSSSTATSMVPTLLALPHPTNRDHLTSLNTPDPLSGEQTWPTDEELRAGEEAMEADGDVNGKDREDGGRERGEGTVTTRSGRKKVPKGTSEYQAAWIGSGSEGEEDDEDEDEEGDGIGGEGMDDAHGMDDGADAQDQGDWEDMSTGSVSATSSASASSSNPDSTSHRKTPDPTSRRSLALSHLSFPDELDTPLSPPARVRFARYRGLQSARGSKWDVYEDLPERYGNVWEFGRGVGQAVRKRAGKEAGESGGQGQEEDEEGDGEGEGGMEVDGQSGGGTGRVRPGGYVHKGTRVTVVIEGVPRDWNAHRKPHHPTLLISLFPHEVKTTLVHSHLVHHTSHTSSHPIKSKDPLLIQVGFRRHLVRPVYSEPGKGDNGVSRFERWFWYGEEQKGRMCVGTWWGPVTWGSVGVMGWKVESGEVSPTLVATGTLLPPGNNRVIAKRIVLSGHPYKINKKTVVVRKMFYNKEDIEYFKPVQLRSKNGRTGNILESVGTHGHMKCLFDGPMKPMDTVTMSLYKRVHPKWGTRAYRRGEGVESVDDKGEVARAVVEWSG